jgi:phospholipase D1/2
VKVCIAGATVARTSVIHNCDEPCWDENFRIPLAHRASELEIVIKDEDMFGAQIIGTATVPASSIISCEPFDKWLFVMDPSGLQDGPKPQLHIAFKFTPVDVNPVYKDGIAGDPLCHGVEDAYFPLRKGGQVTLYQDAHVKDGELPEIRLDGERVFAHEKCWEDICHAILEARHLIYIVGWSIYTEVKLVREPTRTLPKAGLQTLGELLKYKSEEGVRVCLLVWDDRTSNESLMINMVSKA